MPRRAEPIRPFASEAEERRFWESHDSTDHVDWRRAERVRLPNLRPSTTSISLRLPVGLLGRIKVATHKRDVPYQSLIKTWLAESSTRADVPRDAARRNSVTSCSQRAVTLSRPDQPTAARRTRRCTHDTPAGRKLARHFGLLLTLSTCDSKTRAGASAIWDNLLPVADVSS
jgi:predicted DNA binding CopG/RHH family protein